MNDEVKAEEQRVHRETEPPAVPVYGCAFLPEIVLLLGAVMWAVYSLVKYLF